jgi:predicted DNA-binding protein with PD1-like motif
MKQIRLIHDRDLLEEITEYCEKNNINQGYVNVIGALKSVCLGYYSQNEFKYQNKSFEGGFEIASCTGNISLKDGKPFVHIHLVASDENYQTLAGHVAKGCKIFAGECTIIENKEETHSREFDEVTRLALWKK